MISAIIFDIGNVLADFAWAKKYRSYGFTDEEYEGVVNATVKSREWVEYDRGVWSDEQIAAAFVKNAPWLEEQIRRSQENLHGIVTRNDYAIPWLQSLKGKGYRVYYLSNFSRKIYRECEDALDFLPLMDGGIMSYTINQVKPDEGIYRALLERYDLTPEECVFIDDCQVNLDGAQECGIHTILFQDKEQAMADLERMLGEG